jgi:hypothetical protein
MSDMGDPRWGWVSIASGRVRYVAKIGSAHKEGAVREAALLRRRESGVLDDLRPLLAFRLDEAAEMLRAVAGNREALIGKLGLDARIGHRLVGDAVEFLDVPEPGSALSPLLWTDG